MDDACGRRVRRHPDVPRETVNRVIRSGNGSAISGWQMVAMGADYEELLRVALLKNGPIALAFNANGMDFYIHGVTGCTQGWCDSGSIDHHVPCDPAVLDHAVLVVGYGTQTGSAYYLDRSQDEVEVPYWVIKNSRRSRGARTRARARARAPPSHRLPPNGLPTVGILTINVFGACAFSTGGEAIGAKMDTTASCAVTITAASRTLRSTPWSTKSLRSESRNERPAERPARPGSRPRDAGYSGGARGRLGVPGASPPRRLARAAYGPGCARPCRTARCENRGTSG